MIFTRICLLNLLVWIFSIFWALLEVVWMQVCNFFISSVIVGTFRFPCMTLLVIYHEAFTIARRTFSWYLCNISMFELLAVPQRGILYIQVGCRVVLYRSNLFCIGGSDFLPNIHYIYWNFRPTCFLLVNTWVRHVSLLSTQIAKYLAVSVCGIWFPFSVTVGQFSLFKVKVIWVDLFSLAFICQRFNHFSNWLRWFWSFLDTVIGFWYEVRIAVSSAEGAVSISSVSGRSALNIE
jgi:hypothetical protein